MTPSPRHARPLHPGRSRWLRAGRSTHPRAPREPLSRSIARPRRPSLRAPTGVSSALQESLPSVGQRRAGGRASAPPRRGFFISPGGGHRFSGPRGQLRAAPDDVGRAARLRMARPPGRLGGSGGVGVGPLRRPPARGRTVAHPDAGSVARWSCSAEVSARRAPPRLGAGRRRSRESPYRAVHPPSMLSMLPFMNSTSSSHRNKTPFAISEGFPRRPIGL